MYDLQHKAALLTLVGLILIATFTAYFANQKGRNPFTWFGLGFFFGIFGLIILYFLPNLHSTGPAMALSKPAPSLNPPAPIIEIERTADEDKLWYYLDKDHAQMGPVSVIALRDLWNRGLLNSESLVWSEGMDEWQKVEALPGLKIQSASRG